MHVGTTFHQNMSSCYRSPLAVGAEDAEGGISGLSLWLNLWQRNSSLQVGKTLWLPVSESSTTKYDKDGEPSLGKEPSVLLAEMHWSDFLSKGKYRFHSSSTHFNTPSTDNWNLTNPLNEEKCHHCPKNCFPKAGSVILDWSHQCISKSLVLRVALGCEQRRSSDADSSFILWL